MKQINLRVSEDLLEQIDQARGDVPRERWIRSLIVGTLEADALRSVAVTVDGHQVAPRAASSPSLSRVDMFRRATQKHYD